MARRKAPNRIQGGRTTRLMDAGIHKTLADAIELGVPITIACEGAGVSSQAFRNWMRRGAGEHEARAAGEQSDPNEVVYMDLYLDVLDRRAKAATRNVGLIQKVAQGGIVTEKTTRKYRDHDGNLVEEETIKRTAPDWRASAWYLERSHRSEYGKDVSVVEISGPGGAPLEGPRTQEDELANRLTQFLAEHVITPLAALNPGQSYTDTPLVAPHGPSDDDADVVDADVVDD